MPRQSLPAASPGSEKQGHAPALFLQSPHELRMVRKRGQPIQLSTIPGHPGISVGQRKKERKHKFSIVEVGVEERFRC